MRIARAALVLLLLGGGLLPAGAQPSPPGGRGWQQLNPDERRRAWENYQRYQGLPQERQRMIDRRFQQFQAMPPEEKQRLRQNYETYRGLDQNQRREFTEKYRRWKSDRR